MAILSDAHLHSSFSGDSDAPMRDMIQAGLRLGMEDLCFTEHMDFDFPDTFDPPGTFEVDTDAYFARFCQLKQEYEGRIRLRFGIELGLQPHLSERLSAYLARYPFDFVIGSSHLCQGEDPYQAPYWEGRSAEEGCRAYFQSILENLSVFSQMDVYGHLDYVIRVCPDKDRHYYYERYADLLDPILDRLVETDTGLEINTGSLRYGLREPHPCARILSQYYKKGGRIVTIGSDAHDPAHMAHGFSAAEALLKDCGFSGYTVFKERRPYFHRL